MKYLFWNIILQIRTNIAFYLFDMIFFGHFIIELEKLFWLQMENNVFESLLKKDREVKEKGKEKTGKWQKDKK